VTGRWGCWGLCAGTMGAPGDEVMADEDKVPVPGEAAKAGETSDAHEPATQKAVIEESDGKQVNGDSLVAVEKDATGDASMDDAAEEDEVGRQKEEALRQALLKKKDGAQDHKDEKAGKSDRKRERRCVRNQNVGPVDWSFSMYCDGSALLERATPRCARLLLFF
jgi:hypothetical protein